MSGVRGQKCDLCGHALSMHNELPYCRSRSVPRGFGLHPGECPCDGTGRYIDLRAALGTAAQDGEVGS